MARLLLVDDDRKMSQTIGEYLSWNGFSVDKLEGHSELLAILAKNDYDLLIFNAYLDSAGYAVLRKIRQAQDSRLRNLGILVFAPEPPDFKESLALRQLNLYFIAKYQDTGEWVNKIKRILHNRQRKP